MVKVVLVVLAALVFAAGAVSAPVEVAQLHRYVSSHVAWNTNSYWIEGETGVALIDAQLLPSDARRLAQQIKATGKPLAGVIITHPHMDHFGGLPVLRDILGDFPVYASQATRDAVPGVHRQILGAYGMPNAFGEALDSRVPQITHLLQDGDTLTLGGVALQVFVLGPGEAADNLIVYQEDLNAVFAGDTFYPFTHYYLGEGRISGVLGHLNYLKTHFGPDTYVMPGHNDPGRMASVDTQMRYVAKLVALVRAARQVSANVGDNGYLTAQARAGVVAAMKTAFPGYDDFSFGADQILSWNSMGVETAILSGDIPATEDHQTMP